MGVVAWREIEVGVVVWAINFQDTNSRIQCAHLDRHYPSQYRWQMNWGDWIQFQTVDAPCWFYRWTCRLFFGIRWTRIK